MRVSRIGLYQPTWGDDAVRSPGHDEDVVTLAVAAGLLVEPDTSVNRVVIVASSPDVLEGFGSAVVSTALRLRETTPVELRVGGPAVCLEAMAAANEGTLVLGVDTRGAAGASAVLIGSEGTELVLQSLALHSLPMRVQHVGSVGRDDYDDPRLERERGWGLALAQLGEPSDGPLSTVVVGIGPKDAKRLGSAHAVNTTGASSPGFALAEVATSGGRVVALEAGSVAVATVAPGSARLVRSWRPAVSPQERPKIKVAADIPLSLPAYQRAFAAKVGLVASQCECGAVDFPPRSECSSCGRRDQLTARALPRTGEVYTGVKVHVPVPGVPGPYAVAVIQIDDLPVRVLAPVTDSAAADPVIGSRGNLVLRRIAVREGVPDYGYAWQPELQDEVTR